MIDIDIKLGTDLTSFTLTSITSYSPDWSTPFARDAACGASGSSTTSAANPGKGREPLRHYQPVVTKPLAPVVDLPARRAMLGRRVRNPHTWHEALRRNPGPLILRTQSPF